MNNVKKLIICAIFLMPIESVLSIELLVGDSRVQDEFNNQETSDALLKMGAYGMQAYIESEDKKFFYVLMGNVLGKLDLLNNRYIGGKELKRSVNEYLEPLIEQRYRDICKFGCFGDDASEQKLELTYELNPENTLGCYGNSPLRYGDLDGDTTDEIVLFLGEDLVMFSPEQEAIIFSQNLNIADWMSKEETSQWITDFGKAGPLGDQHPQYQSSIIAFTSANYQSVQAGYRGYGKLYFGDFNSDGKRDIIVWRKIYQSLLRGNTKDGFALKKDNYLHYEKSASGIYDLADTDANTINGWLTSKDLTWSKGYPSKSECAGQEGQLIPEMHDPLLNDPDVLK